MTVRPSVFDNRMRSRMTDRNWSWARAYLLHRQRHMQNPGGRWPEQPSLWSSQLLTKNRDIVCEPTTTGCLVDISSHAWTDMSSKGWKLGRHPVRPKGKRGDVLYFRRVQIEASMTSEKSKLRRPISTVWALVHCTVGHLSSDLLYGQKNHHLKLCVNNLTIILPTIFIVVDQKFWWSNVLVSIVKKRQNI